MAACDDPEPMDTSDEAEVKTQLPEPATKGELSSSHDKEGVILMLSLRWSENVKTQKKGIFLGKRLQTWFSRKDKGVNCSVIRLMDKEEVVITVDPPPGSLELQELAGKTLTGKSGTSEPEVTILSVRLVSSELQKHPNIESTTAPPVSLTEPQPDQACILNDLLYWCVKHMYKEELDRILEKNDVEIATEVHVSFMAKGRNGNPKNAYEEYTDLSQKCSKECVGGNSKYIPLKYVDLEQWNTALMTIKENKKKLCITATSGGVCAFGPLDSQDVFNENLTSTNTIPSIKEPSMNPEPSTKVILTIKDDFLKDGLILDEDSWIQMTSSYAQQIEGIKSKFKVDFNTSASDQGTVIVKAFFNLPGVNEFMESHAIRALLSVHQKIETFSNSINSFTLKYSSDSSELSQAASGPALDESVQSEDTCPICRDTFTNKTMLLCKHSFCEECLQQSKETCGPVCPVCRNVFGVMEGNQPDGTMTYRNCPNSLPGYSNCGKIIITYVIPSGIQTEKHPKPRQRFTGLHRDAYLPDNEEGKEVLKLLERAFGQKLIFTVGTSRTTGIDNQVTWNDIHHKTNTHGGPQGFGYPDPDYLSRVKDELKAKGIM